MSIIKLLLLCLLFTNINLSAQKSVNAQIITLENDTIESKMRVKTNIFDKMLIMETSFFQTMVLLDEKEKKSRVIPAKDVFQLTFKDFNDKTRIYRNHGNQLMEILHFGKIKWIRTFSINMKDGAINAHDLLIGSDLETYNLGMFNNRRNQLLEATSSRPDLINEIEHMKINDDNIKAVLLKFDDSADN
ncbi:hypothetical protein [Moheibacter lacus]|uniref:DUF4412 domain-containing protein n=1 Tax=Moheibacter lacus TaxID=2745851 RepID=A0A838ZT76_9FLAO|nr:hypothetical protein [Moheibacter lacus]MBA5630195.1 hypothetical protein [Moheibacter lacus]